MLSCFFFLKLIKKATDCHWKRCPDECLNWGFYSRLHLRCDPKSIVICYTYYNSWETYAATFVILRVGMIIKFSGSYWNLKTSPTHEVNEHYRMRMRSIMNISFKNYISPILNFPQISSDSPQKCHTPESVSIVCELKTDPLQLTPIRILFFQYLASIYMLLSVLPAFHYSLCSIWKFYM